MAVKWLISWEKRKLRKLDSKWKTNWKLLENDEN